MRMRMAEAISAVVFAVLLCAATVADNVPAGHLFAGTSNPGCVYSYAGGSNWRRISPILGYAVLDLIEFKGRLYAATMSTSDPQGGAGGVWRYEDDDTWTLVGEQMDNQVCDLIEWQGECYAGTAWRGGKLFVLDEETETFEFLDYVNGWSGIRAMYVWKFPWIQLGDIWWDKFGRYDGKAAHHDVHLWGSCVYDFAAYDNALYAAAFMGRLFRSTDGVTWAEVRGYEDGNLWELETFRGALYMGDNEGRLRTLDGAHDTALVWTTSQGIISMLADGDETLYIGTGGEAGAYYGSSTSGDGYVYAFAADGAAQPVSGRLGTGVQCLYRLDFDLGVTALSATAIGTTSAQFCGQVTSNEAGEGCQYRFCYWTTDDEQMFIRHTDWTGEVSTGDTFSATVTDLSAGCEYRFWAEVRNSQGQADSAILMFTTLTGPVQVLSPNGGECLLGGEATEIVWGADKSVDSVVLSYSVDDGQTWDDIATLDNDDANKHHPWTPGILNSTKCLMQIRDAADASTMDTSDGVFEICDPGIPDVRGMSEGGAQSALKSHDYAAGRISYDYFASVPAGQVAFQWPTAGTSAPAGTEVRLVISYGKAADIVPTVETQAVSEIGANSAQLRGKIVDAGGGTCRYRFYYWTEGDMWIRHTDWEGYAEQGESFSLLVDGLKPGRKYWFWAEARNSAGLSDGWGAGIRVFATRN